MIDDVEDSDSNTLKRRPLLFTEHTVVFCESFTVKTSRPPVLLAKRSVSNTSIASPDISTAKRWKGFEIPTPIKLFRKPVDIIPPNTPALYSRLLPANRKKNALTVSGIEAALGVIEDSYRT
jgi:hypothetical protein